MKPHKANISLMAAAETGRSGLWLSLRKGLCELRRGGKGRRRKTPMPQGTWEKKLSVILCTSGQCPGLSAAAESALAQSLPREEYEVLVVWNREDSPPAEDFPPEIRWVQESTPGISYARNAGAVAAKGEILLYLDDDAVADENLAACMTETFQKHPRAAVVGGQIFLKLPDPPPPEVLPGREGLWSAYVVSFSGYRQVKEQYAFPYGACFAVRKSALAALGGFPTEYGRVGNDYGGGEETALCFQVLKQGWEIGIQPSAWVEHRVEPRRFCREHIQKTIRAGILTSYRLCREGYAPPGWDAGYVKERLEIARLEEKRLSNGGNPWEQFYKRCEAEAFQELWESIKGECL